jgi:hypothetical protein
MAITFTDDFSAHANGTQLTAIGAAAWAYVQKTAGTLSTAAAVNGSAQLASTGSGKTGAGIYRHNAGDADHYIKASFQSYPSGLHSLAVRVTDADNFIALDVRTSNVFFRKRVAGVDTTLGSAVNTNVAGDVYEVRLVGNTASVRKNGTQIISSASTTDVPASTYVGILPTAASNYILDNLEAGNFLAGDTLTVATISKLYQAQGSGRAIAISGTYGGGVTGIEYRVEQGGVALTGLDWQALGGSFAAGVWSGTTAAIPVGGASAMYSLRVRATGVTLEATAQPFGVGLVVGVYGQSNAVQFLETNGGSAGAMPATAWLMRGSVWEQGAVYGASAAAIRLSTLLGIPVGFIQGGAGGQPATAFVPGAGTGYYEDFEDDIDLAGGDIGALYWNQGEAGPGNVTSYKAALSSIRSALLAHTGRAAADMPFLIALLGRYNGTPDSTINTNYNLVRQAQREWAGENTGGVVALTEFDEAQTDEYHFTGAAQQDIGKRLAQSLAAYLGTVTPYGHGPALLSASRVGATVTVAVDLNDATSLTKATGAAATGWTATTNDWVGTVTISDVQISGSNVVLTLAADPGGATVKVRHLYDASPDVTNQIKGTGYPIPDIGLQNGEMTASTLITGTFAATDEDDAFAAAGSVEIAASFSMTDEDDEFAAVAGLAIFGELALTDEDDVFSSGSAVSPVVYARIPSGAKPSYRRLRPAALSTARRRN